MPLFRRGSSTTVTGSPEAALAPDKMSAWSIASRVLAATTPLTVVAGVDPVGMAVTGINAPLVFLLVTLGYGLFCICYLAAARLCEEQTQDASSGFYALIRRGLGRTAGTAAGWLTVVAYTALTLGLYGLIGNVLSPPLSALLGITLPWQAIAIAAAVLVGWLGLLKFRTPTRVLMVLVTCEVAMISVATVANWLHPATGTRLTDALDPHQLTVGPAVIAAWLALAVLGLIGTELTVVHTDDARDGHRGVSRATVAVLAILTLLYVAAPAGLSMTLGVDGVVTAAQTDPAGLFVRSVENNLGPQLATITQILFGTSVLAGALSFHGTTSRYCMHLANDDAAPALLAKLGTRHGSPTVASLTQTVFAFAAIGLVWGLGADPVQVLFYFGGTGGAVAILILLTLTALSAVFILVRHRRRLWKSYESPRTEPGTPWPSSTVTWNAAAAIAAVLVVGALTGTVLFHLDTLFGVAPDSPLLTIVPVSYLGVCVVGVAWELWRRRSRVADQTTQAGRSK